jgi:hypothetical protein
VSESPSERTHLPGLSYPAGSAAYYFHLNAERVVRILEHSLEKIADGAHDEWWTREAKEALTNAAIAANRRPA